MAKQKDSKEIEVRTAEALTRDVGRGIARVDPDILSKLGWETGDVIEIEGRKKTYALLWPAQPSDSNRGIIRIDGATRNNAGVGIDDKVKYPTDRSCLRGPDNTCSDRAFEDNRRRGVPCAGP